MSFRHKIKKMKLEISPEKSFLKYPSTSKRINIHQLLLLLDVMQRKANKPEKDPYPIWILYKMSLKIQDDQK